MATEDDMDDAARLGQLDALAVLAAALEDDYQRLDGALHQGDPLMAAAALAHYLFAELDAQGVDRRQWMGDQAERLPRELG